MTDLSEEFREELSQLVHDYQEQGLSEGEIYDALQFYGEYVAVGR